MRIAVDVTCWCNRRGFGRFTRELVTALSARCEREELVLLADSQTARCRDLPLKHDLATAPTSVAAVRAASAQGNRPLLDMLAMGRMVRKIKPDMVFFPAVYSYFPVPLGVPCVVTFHDAIAELLPRLALGSWRNQLLWLAKCRLALRQTSTLLTVSQASKADLVRHFGLSPHRVGVVEEAPSSIFHDVKLNGGVSTEVLARHGLDGRKPFLLYVGGLSPHKNLSTLIEAMAQVRQTMPSADLQLVLVGDYTGDAFNSCYPELMQLVSRHHLNRAVHFAGYVSDGDLVHLYSGCEAFVLPSYLEGFGLPAAEAMACGAAVLVSDRGSLPEVVGEAGVLFDPDKTEGLAAAILAVVTNGDYRDRLRQLSRKRASHFSWDRAAQQTRQFLYAAAGAAPCAPAALASQMAG